MALEVEQRQTSVMRHRKVKRGEVRADVKD